MASAIFCRKSAVARRASSSGLEMNAVSNSAAGMSAPWLPRILLGRSIALTDVRSAVARAVPILRRLERWSRPRVSVFETALGMRGMGIALLALALALIVAAPIVGQIPLGLAVCLVGLGLVERDGLVVMGGLVIGVFGVAINAGFAYAVIAGIVDVLLRLGEAGIPLALATAKPTYQAETTLDHFGLRQHFKVVAGGIALLEGEYALSTVVADADPSDVEHVGVALGRGLDHRAVACHDPQTDDATRQVAEVQAGAVRGGGRRAAPAGW